MFLPSIHPSICQSIHWLAYLSPLLRWWRRPPAALRLMDAGGGGLCRKGLAGRGRVERTRRRAASKVAVAAAAAMRAHSKRKEESRGGQTQPFSFLLFCSFQLRGSIPSGLAAAHGSWVRVVLRFIEQQGGGGRKRLAFCLTSQSSGRVCASSRTEKGHLTSTVWKGRHMHTGARPL